MKIDVLLIPVGARYAEMRAAALAAEAAGFDGLWTWDHLRDPDERAEAGVPEAWTTLTALAEVTRRLTLGPLVLNTGLRLPAAAANPTPPRGNGRECGIPRVVGPLTGAQCIRNGAYVTVDGSSGTHVHSTQAHG